MKLVKILMPIATATIVAAPIIASTSCSCTVTTGGSKSDETSDGYIYNRTFSILGTADAGGTETYLNWGTCWILSDATPNDTTDYVYNIVTNWHVMKGIEDVHEAGSNGKYWFGCNDKTSGLSPFNGFEDFVQFKSFTKKADVNFSFNGTSKITTKEYDQEQRKYVEKTGLRGCDIFVATADFSSFATSSSSSASIAKAKLDKLNQITASGKKITQLADTVTDTNHFENKKLYIGGYPVKKSYYATWEKHDLSSENISMVYNTGTRDGSDEGYSHWCDGHASPLIECSPQYYSDTNVGTSWMQAGASGSMLIGNFGTDSAPIWKVCGIYWGGYGDGYTAFYPYFSIFNSNWKNYLSQWA